MPIYEYECIPEKHRFEVIQKFNDPPVTHCTVCGNPVQRLLSAPAIQFRGTGWYITDYARKGKGESTEAKSESKPEPSSDTKASTATSETSSKKSE